jgi:hypothetical protein
MTEKDTLLPVWGEFLQQTIENRLSSYEETFEKVNRLRTVSKFKDFNLDQVVGMVSDANYYERLNSPTEFDFAQNSFHLLCCEDRICIVKGQEIIAISMPREEGSPLDLGELEKYKAKLLSIEDPNSIPFTKLLHIVTRANYYVRAKHGNDIAYNEYRYRLFISHDTATIAQGLEYFPDSKDADNNRYCRPEQDECNRCEGCTTPGYCSDCNDDCSKWEDDSEFWGDWDDDEDEDGWEY